MHAFILTRLQSGGRSKAAHRGLFTLFACLLLLPTWLGTASAIAAQTPGASPVATPHGASDSRLVTIKPVLRDQVAGQLPTILTTYLIDVTLHVDRNPGSLQGTLTVDYVNETGTTLEVLPFRLYANDAGEDFDSIVVDDVVVNGVPTETKLSVGNSVLTVPLEEPIAPEATVTIEMNFEAIIPVDTEDHYGIFGINSETGTWALAHWYPIVAGWDPENGFELDPTSIFGDPIFSTTALYDVTITAPDDWAIVATGNVVGKASNGGLRRWDIQSGPVRDFTFVADGDLASVSTEVDGTTITSWFNPGSERVGDAVLTYAAQSMELFNVLIGPYPYLEFDIVPVELYGAAGVEFPQLIYIAQSYYGENQNLEVPNYLDFTVAHEVLHQWWYGLVGNNQYIHAFTDEGLTNLLSSRIYFSEIYGEAVGGSMFASAVEGPFQDRVETGEDQIVDQPTDDFTNERAYAWAAYSKAPVGFNAIYDEIGEEAFFAAVHAYFEDFAFKVAQPGDLLAAFEKASGRDLSVLWNHWFEEAESASDI